MLYPSDSNNRPKLFALSDVTGLQEWVDYIPVQVETQNDALKNKTDVGGYKEVNSLASDTGLLAWVDYTPVYLVTDRTKPWQCDPDGYIPVYAAEGTLSAGDANFANVKLLVPAEGVDDGTTFVDESNSAFTVTSESGVVTSIDQNKFGSTSAYFSGLADRLSFSSNDIIDDTTADFTIEGWMYQVGDPFVGGSVTPGNGCNVLVAQTANGSTGDHRFGIEGSGANNASKVRYYRGGRIYSPGQPNSDIVDLVGTTDLDHNEWHYIALTYEHATTTMRIYANGNLEAINTSIPDGGWPNTVENTNMTAFVVGDNYVPSYSGFRQTMNGYIEDLRVTQGVARYTGSTHTVPTAAHPHE